MNHSPWHRFLPTAYFLLPTPRKHSYYVARVAKGQGLGASEVRIVIFDVLGREITTLVNARQAPGTYEVGFDGSRLASGVYFYKLVAGDFVATKSLLLLR